MFKLLKSQDTQRGFHEKLTLFAIPQVGMPSDKNQYVHRLGRTARAGKTGDGVLLLADFERFFLNSCKDQPIKVRRIEL